MKQKLLFVSFLFINLNIIAQTFDGEVGNSWNVPENWSGNEVPLPTGNVIIPNGFDVVAPSAININSLEIQGGASLTTNNNLVFTDNVIIQENATLNWNGGGLSGINSALPLIGNVGTMNIFGTIQMSNLLFTNNGTINFLSGDIFSMNQNAGIVNNTTGLIEFSVGGTSLINPGGGPSNIINNGTVRVAHANAETTFSASFWNSASLEIQNGSLRFFNNLIRLNPGSSISVSENAELHIDNTINIFGISSGTVNGIVNWDAKINVTGDTVLDFSGSGSIEANSAELVGSGTLTTNFEVNVNNSIFTLDDAEWINTGIINLKENSTVTIANTSRLENASTGVIDFVGDASRITSSSTNTLLENFGLIKVSLPNATDIAILEPNFSNQNSEILVDSGTLQIGRFGSTVATLNDGIYDIDPDATLNLGKVNINGTLTGEIDGQLNWLDDIFISGESNLQFNIAQGEFNLDGGSLRGGGVLINETYIRVLGNSPANILEASTLENEWDMDFFENANLRIGVDCNLINRENGQLYFGGDNSGIGRFGNGNNILENYGELFTLDSGLNVRIGAETINYGSIGVTDSEFWFDNILVNEAQGVITGENGTIRLPTVAVNFINNGVYSPGNDITSFTLINQYSSSPTATWVVNIQGNEQGISYDYTEIQGNATFNGDLIVTVIDYQPTVGEEFVIATTTGTILECNLPSSIAVAEGPGIFAEYLVECRNDNELVLTFNGALSTNEFEIDQISIYPNPTSDLLYINDSSNLITHFELFSVTGKHILKQKFTNQPIALSHLENGLYLIKLHSDNEEIVRRIIKH